MVTREELYEMYLQICSPIIKRLYGDNTEAYITFCKNKIKNKNIFLYSDKLKTYK